MNKSQVGNPKSERSPKPEIRLTRFVGRLSFRFRISGLIRHSSFLLLCALLALGSGCRRDMFNQPFSKPLERSDFFQDNHMASRPLVEFTVARGHLNEDEAFYTGKIGTNLVIEFPITVTRELLERGRERFDIYCSPCHGRSGEGTGMIVQRG